MRMLTIMILFTALVQCQEKKSEPLNVCEVLSNLTAYRGQRISVRGEFVGGEEGSVLVGSGCRSVVTDGHSWPVPTPIALTYPESPRSENPGAATPKPKVEPLDPELLKTAGPGAKVYVTVTGRLDTRAHFEMVRRGDGKVVPFGYGHQAECVAQIVYDEIKDFTVVPAKR